MKKSIQWLMLLAVCILPCAAQNNPPVLTGIKDTTIRIGTYFNFSFVKASDPDGDAMTYAWLKISGPASGDSIYRATSLGTRVNFSLPGEYRYSITVSDGELSALDSIKVTVQDSIAAKILTPEGGEKLVAGSTFTITWEVNDPGTPADVHLTTNNGVSYELLNDGSIRTDSYEWTITQAPSDTCYIKVTPYGETGIIAMSNRFSIISDTAAIHPFLKASFPNAHVANSSGPYLANGRIILKRSIARHAMTIAKKPDQDATKAGLGRTLSR